MASPIEYQIQGEHTTGLTPKHYHGEAISTLNNWAKNNLPPYAVVSSVKVKYRGKVSTGDTKFYVGFTNSSDTEPRQKIISSELTTSSNNSWEQPLPFSGLNIVSSYSRLNFWASSGIIMKKYTCYDFRVIWDFYIPTYTLTVKAGTGGTVTGGGTFEAGKTATITATPSTGYKFKQWNDGNTSASRSVTVTANATYTAEFELLEYPVVIDYQESVSGEKCTVSGAGTYKFGDTVTLKVTSVPAYHTFNGCDVFTGKGVHQYDTETITFTLNTDFIKGDEASITVLCYITHTGYLVKANVSSDDAGSVNYGDYILAEYRETGGNVPVDGFKVIYADRNMVGIRAQPNTGYEFVSWNDGNTENPRRLYLTGDVTYTAIFKKKQFYVYFKNYDGVNLQNVILVDYGDIPVYSGNTPTRPGTVECTYEFIGWDREILPVTYNTEYYAQYKETKKQYELRTFVSPDEGGSVTEGGMYDYGTPVTIIATPNEGYRFVKWLDDASLTNPVRVIVINETTPNYRYTAIFKKLTFTITVNADVGGKVSGGGSYEYGSTATLTATADNCYEFVRWQDGDTSNPRNIVVTGEATYTAIFRVNRILGNKTRAIKVKFNLDEVKGLLLDHTKIYEK